MDPSLPVKPLRAVNSNRTFPVSESIAATRLNGQPRYMMPFTTIGMDWLGRNGNPSRCMENVHAGISFATFCVLIWANGENR